MTRDELLAIIDQAAREEWEELDLRGEEITELPPEIGRLTALKRLSIGASTPGQRNPLTNLPLEFGQLTSLLSLNLSRNQLTSVPPIICQLPNLKTLDLSRNHLNSMPLEIGQLINLQRLDIGQNQLAEICPEIGRLASLKSLRLHNNRLITLPPEIGQLRNLETLHLGNNKLQSIPAEIEHFACLRVLHLGGNKLTTLPQTIGQIANLEQLYVNANRLTVLCSEIGQLTNLQELYLNSNRLTAVPPEIGKLISLQELYLNDNHLTTIPPEIGQLTNLQRLSLWKNQLTAISPKIGQLTNLQKLSLGNNQFTTLPPEIGQLISLRELYIHDNQLSTLPMALRRLVNLKKLHLYGNALPIPSELLGDEEFPSHPPFIIFDAYFQSSRPLAEAKLLLVGEGSVGKTSLVERLLRNRLPSDKGKTIGVDIHTWVVESEKLRLENEELAGPDTRHNTQDVIRLNVWDFGGQEIYHTTHQFFLTHRSLYLIVLESRKDESANRLEYWLRHVQSFAGDAPIIIVVNKSDQHRMVLDERGLMLKYPAIQAIIHISCMTGEGIPQLRQVIETALATMPHINDWIPLTWFAVKEKLADLDKDYLPYESFVELCMAEGIEHEAAQRTLARFLHDLGTALNFQDDRRLAGTNVLNPEWVTGGIYHILNASFLQGQGILRLRDLDKILNIKRYPRHKQPFLLDIMHKFELCVPMGDGRRYLIPGLLPKERPDFDWPSTATIDLEYRYAILPATVLSRLMVRLHHHTWSGSEGQPIRWRNGLVLARDGCRALVVADPTAARLTIALDGPIPHRRQLLSAVRTELAEIHASFAKLEAEEWVPIPDKPGAAIQYRALLNLEARGIFTHYDPGNDVEIDVRALLDGIETQAERDVRTLVHKLIQQFDVAELRHLAFELQVDHEDLPSETKMDLARELVLHCQRRGRLAELQRVVGEKRPFL
jgi:internalin A